MSFLLRCNKHRRTSNYTLRQWDAKTPEVTWQKEGGRVALGWQAAHGPRSNYAIKPASSISESMKQNDRIYGQLRELLTFKGLKNGFCSFTSVQIGSELNLIIMPNKMRHNILTAVY